MAILIRSQKINLFHTVFLIQFFVSFGQFYLIWFCPGGISWSTNHIVPRTYPAYTPLYTTHICTSAYTIRLHLHIACVYTLDICLIVYFFFSLCSHICPTRDVLRTHTQIHLKLREFFFFFAFYSRDHLFSDTLYMEMASTRTLQGILTNGTITLAVVSYKNLTHFLPRMYFDRNR